MVAAPRSQASKAVLEHSMRLPRRPLRERRPVRPGLPRPAFDPTDLTGIEALGIVLSAYAAERLAGRGDKRASDRALRNAAKRLAAEARARDAVRAECLLIDLRSAWSQLPAVQRVHDAAVRRDLWDRVVLLCCEEFYAVEAGYPLTGQTASSAV
jgi:hypothetical protein